jgi:hypothetical protein
METLKKESNQRVGVCNVLAESHGKSWKMLESSMESPGNRWNFPWKVSEIAGSFHRKSRKLPDDS